MGAECVSQLHAGKLLLLLLLLLLPDLPLMRRCSQIANAFKAGRRQWHPDRHRSEPLEKQAYAEEMFKLLSLHAPK